MLKNLIRIYFRILKVARFPFTKHDTTFPMEWIGTSSHSYHNSIKLSDVPNQFNILSLLRKTIE